MIYCPTLVSSPVSSFYEYVLYNVKHEKARAVARPPAARACASRSPRALCKPQAVACSLALSTLATNCALSR